MSKGIWTKYGMTRYQYRILVNMKPGCWICGRTTKLDGTPLRLYTDHDHTTGRVRGRLDYTCNRRLIGRRRNGDLYRKAATYLDSDFDGRKIEEKGKEKTRAIAIRLRGFAERFDDSSREQCDTENKEKVDYAVRLARKPRKRV